MKQKILMMKRYKMKLHSIECLEKLLYKSDDIQVVQIAKMDCYSELFKIY